MNTTPERAFKYHGLGNDFIVLDRRVVGLDIDSKWAQALCDRRRGVGADGVLTLLPSDGGAARMVVHNADGSVPEMCGNGLRCAVKFLVDHAAQKPEVLSVETGAGLLSCKVRYSGGLASEIEVDMGPARLVAPHLPSAHSGTPFVAAALEGFPGLRGTAVSMGNPHLVLFSTPLEAATSLGPRLEVSPLFPERTNVGFARLREGGMDLVVWERGSGLTQACGTGACAAVAAAVYEGRLAPGAWHEVRLPGGALQISVPADLSQVLMRGPADFAFAFELPSE